MHAHGNGDAARLAFDCLGEALGCDGVTAARQVLDVCGGEGHSRRRGAGRGTISLSMTNLKLVGEGGGAGALVPFIAEQMKLDHEISRDAEVISSIGAALALVRDVVERLMPHPQPEDLQAIREEVIEAVVRLGAARDAVDVAVDVDTTNAAGAGNGDRGGRINVRDETWRNF